jgi:hypothetical protein
MKKRIKTEYHFTNNFWHEYFNIKIVKRRKKAICKYCNEEIEVNNEAGIVNYKFGHDLPDNFFDIHFDGCIGIVHILCVNKFVKNEKRY